jgi:(p)ppGpp synthase/HD superfamily hydrolase
MNDNALGHDEGKSYASILAFVKMKHENQLDKAGQPYFDHLRQVADLVPSRLVYAALGHDLMEDTSATTTEMIDAGFSVGDLLLIQRLTHEHFEPYKTYIRRVSMSPDATIIKIADITSNLSRLALIDQETQDRLRVKYFNALVQLVDS